MVAQQVYPAHGDERRLSLADQPGGLVEDAQVEGHHLVAVIQPEGEAAEDDDVHGDGDAQAGPADRLR